MTPIKDLMPEVKLKKTRATEYGELVKYFHSLGLKDRADRFVSIGYIGMLCAPLVRGTKTDRDYGLLYALKSQCEQSNKPQAVAWSYLKPRKRLPPNPALPQGR